MKSPVLQRILNCVDSAKFKKMLEYAIVFVCILYFFLSISSYAAWFPGSTKYFLFSTTLGILIRGVSSILFLGIMALGLVAYRRSIDFRWLIIISVLIFFIIFFTFFSPLSYSALYRTTALYSFMAEIVISVSVKTQIVMTLSFIVDILFGFSFVFILPKIYKKTTLYLLLTYIFIFIILYSCLYSFYFERSWYKYFLSGNWKYNPVSIGSIFGDKQQWGAFLATCFPFCFLMVYILSKMSIKRVLKILSYIFISLTGVMAFFCSIVSFCKTAIISNIVFLFIFFIGLCIYFLVKKRHLFIPALVFTVFAAFLITFILFRTVESLKISKIGLIIDTILKTLKSSGETGSVQRLTILVYFLDRMPATNLMFGFPKGTLEAFELSTTPELINTLHTGFAIFFGRTGIVGTAIYLIIYGILIRAIIYNGKQDFLKTVILLGALGVSFILNLSELEILIMSSSALVFIKNLVLVSMPLSEYHERKEFNETHFISVSC